MESYLKSFPDSKQGGSLMRGIPTYKAIRDRFYSFPQGLTTEYKAVLLRALTLGYEVPSNSQQLLENSIWLDFLRTGLVNELDLFYYFATNGDLNYASLNWMMPSSYKCTINGGMTFTELLGFTGDGTSGYLSTGFNPRSNASKYKIADAGVGGKFVGTTRRSQVLFGVATAGSDDTLLMQQSAGANNFFRVNTDGVGSGVASDTASDLYVHVRRPDAITDYCKINLTETSRALAPDNLPNNTLPIMGANFGGAVASFADGTCKYFFVGSNAAALAMKAVMDNYA